MLRLVLLGDGDSPHLLKWARALAALPDVELWAASSRGFAPGFDACLRAERRLALNTAPRVSGGNLGLMRHLPRLAHWLKRIDANFVCAHYLTSHGTLAWLSRRLFGVKARLVASAWGSDILVTPERSALLRLLTRQVLQDSVLATSDSQVMATRMRALGAHDVMVFPFGLEQMPPAPGHKNKQLFFANRGLEPLYRPERVLAQFAQVAQPGDQLVVANDGSLGAALVQQAAALGLQDRVRFVGRLGAEEQARWYAQACWYLSLPASDSVAVSVLEAMAQGCMPLLSDLPANRELVRHGVNGLIVPEGALLTRTQLDDFAPQAESAAVANRLWVQDHALFAPCVAAFVARLRALA
jgi:L-malate glycosyltransferase